MKRALGLFADIPQVNRVFTLICFAAPPAAGSVVSFLFNGGGAVCLYNVLNRKVALSTVREVRIMSALFLAYVGISLLAAFVNGSATRRPDELLSLVTFAFFPVSYAYWSVSQRGEIVSSAIWGAAIACSSGFALGVVQFVLNPGERIEGGAGNALVFGTVTVIAIAVVVAGILLTQTRHRTLFAGAALCGVLALLLSQSRSPKAMHGVNLVMLLLLFGPRRWLRRLLLPAVAAGVILGGVVAAGVSIPIVSDRFEEMSDDWDLIQRSNDYENSLGIRLAIWEIGNDMWKEAPWLGHGRRAAAEEMGRRLVEIYGIDRSYSHFHNFLLQALVQNGILGVVSLLALLGYALRIAVKTIRDTLDVERRFGAALILIVLVTLVGSGMTNIMFGHDILDAVFMVCMVPGVYLAVGRSMAPAR